MKFRATVELGGKTATGIPVPESVVTALASGSPGNNPRIPSGGEIIDLYRRVYG